MALLAAYSFDEAGDSVTDQSGNGNNFSIAGVDAQRVAGGHTNGGLSWLNSAGGSATLPDIGVTDNRTVMAWIKDLADTPASWAIIWNVPSINSGGWGILHLADGNVYIQARNASTFARASAALPDDDDWHHVAGTYDGSTIRCYVDGVEGTSASLTGPLRTDTDPPLLFLDWLSDTHVIDDLRLYDEALSQAEIETLMNSPVGGAVAVNQAVEHDSAGSVIPVVAVGPAAESDEAGAITPVQIVLIDQATEQDTAGSIAAVVSLDQAAESDSAFVITPVQLVAVAQAAEQDAAGSITAVQLALIGQATEVDGAGIIAPPAIPVTGWPPRAGSLTVTGVATATVSVT